MARTLLTALDLRGNEIRNARIQNLLGAPANPRPGQLYYNSSNNELFFWNATEWVSAKASGPAGGHLTGTFPNPEVADGVLRNQHVAADAGIEVTKLAGLAAAVQETRLDQFAAPTTAVAFNGQRLTGLGAPTAAGDAATRAYVDAVAQQATTTATATNQAWQEADQQIRTDFAAADDSLRTQLRSEFAAADNTVRSEFAAADNALLLAVQGQFQAASDAAAADHAQMRTDFAASQVQLRADLGAEDTAIRAEFAAADAALSTRLDAEATARADADTALGGRVDGEASARAAADTALGVRIDTLASEAGTDLATERDARMAADTALGARVDTEQAERLAADTALGGRLDTEVADRTAGDTALRTDFTAADAAVRTDFAAADTALRDLLRGELAAQDTTLRGDLTAADAALTATLRGEITTGDNAVRGEYQTADAQLRVDFDTADAQIRTDYAAADTALDTSLRAYTDALNTATVASLNTQVADVRSDFAAADTMLDQTLRAYVDSQIAGAGSASGADLAAETAARIDADNGLASDIATVQGNLDSAFSDLSDTFQADVVSLEGLIAAEQAAREAADATHTQLITNISTSQDEMYTDQQQLRTDLTAETAARTAADTALDTALRGLISAGDSALRTDMDAAVAAARTFSTNRGNHTGTQLAATISDFGTTVRAVPLNEMAAAEEDVNLNGQRLTGVGAPVAADDAVNRAYVDGLAQGLDVKASVRAASTVNVTRSGEQVVDGVSVVAGNRVLLRAQTDATQNGIYTVSTGAWQRSGDANDGGELTGGAFTFVEEGEAFGDSGWVLTTDGEVTIGTTPLEWSQFSGAGQIVAGDGLTKNGNTLHALGTAGRIDVTADAIDIADDYVGQDSINTVGTLTSGALGAGFTAVGVAQGGTGAATAVEARANLGAATKSAFTLNTAGAEFNLVHGFNTRDVVVQIHENMAPYAVVEADVEVTDLNAVTVRFGEAVDANAYRVVVVG